jgi:DNA-binding LytR/AlgR family response regulator
MATLNCLIVEDEPLAAQVLEEYLAFVPWIQYVGRCANAAQAAEAMQAQSVDILFLDINLPGLKGLDFFRSLTNPPQTIVTTAYHEYAIEGFELNVTDYLLKPIAFERFFQAINKIKRPDLPTGTPSHKGRRFYFFNVNKKMMRVWLDEIVMVESLREYVRIYTLHGESIMTKYPLSSLELMLKEHQFLRVHRSFLVAIPHISAYTLTEITAGGHTIPVGRQYKQAVIDVLERL